MWIPFRVGEGMMQAMHDRICPWAQVRRTLRNPGNDKEEFLPALTHPESAMCRVPVLEKGLEKQGKVMVPEKEK
jgi:hypothetical protein